MKVILGSVVKGFALKQAIAAHLAAKGYEVVDIGCYGTERFVKFPAIGERIAMALQENAGALAINCCGSGTGAGIAAGKFKGVCAVSCESVKTARLARIVNDANCLCLGEAVVGPELACEMVDAFLSARFQDAPEVPLNVRNFWREARDELMARGPAPIDRKMEYLP